MVDDSITLVAEVCEKAPPEETASDEEEEGEQEGEAGGMEAEGGQG